MKKKLIHKNFRKYKNNLNDIYDRLKQLKQTYLKILIKKAK